MLGIGNMTQYLYYRSTMPRADIAFLCGGVLFKVKGNEKPTKLSDDAAVLRVATSHPERMDV